MTTPGRHDRHRGRGRIDFTEIGARALVALPTIVQRWLPDGKRSGVEWVARNPTRSDQFLGSFKINLVSGRWADFATGAAGGDVISLAAYLFGLSQTEAGRKVAEMLSVRGGR